MTRQRWSLPTALILMMILVPARFFAQAETNQVDHQATPTQPVQVQVQVPEAKNVAREQKAYSVYSVESAPASAWQPSLQLLREDGEYVLAPAVSYEKITGGSVNPGEDLGLRQKIEYQIGTIADLPVLVTLDAPASKNLSEATLSSDIDKKFQSLLREVGKHAEVQACRGDRVCAETCQFNGGKKCCKWRCK